METTMPQTKLTRAEVLARVCELAAGQANADTAGLTEATHLFADLNFDSLAAIEFTMELEDAFEVSISDEQADGVRTVQQAVDMLIGVLESPSETGD